MGTEDRICRGMIARLFKPYDRLCRTRLQQMGQSDGIVPKAELRIPGAQPNGLLYEWDSLLYRADEELTLAKGRECVHTVAIKREHRLVFSDCFPEPVLRAQQRRFGVVGKRAIR